MAVDIVELLNFAAAPFSCTQEVSDEEKSRAK